MKKYSTLFEHFRYKQISLLKSFITIILLFAVILWQFERMHGMEKKSRHGVNEMNSCPPPSVIQYRMSDYRFTKPLLLAERMSDCESADGKLMNIGASIDEIIGREKSSGVLTNASVYLRELNTSRYISIHDNEVYHPASMLKVALMMAILRQSEATPGFLGKVVNVDQLPQESQEIKRRLDYAPGKSIEAGRKYTVKDLIYYMIAESDNSAAILLYKLKDEKIYNELFNTLGLSSPDEGVNQGVYYTVAASEYSRFMRVLYNATYLSNEDADYALSLLVKSEFKEGVLKDLPEGIVAAHKFGEFGWEQDGKAIRDYELHETAIIYLKDSPILVTIMTKGKNKKDLAPVIAEIAKLVYDSETKPNS